MSADRTVYCRNEDGVEVYFDYGEESPFFLEKIDGVMKVSNKVTSSENTMIDGETYQGSVTKARNIVITAHISENHVYNRNLLYKCFKPKTSGLLTYVEEDERRVINYIVEDVDVDPDGVIRYATISLKCHDPFSKTKKTQSLLWQVGVRASSGRMNLRKKKSHSGSASQKSQKQSKTTAQRII